MLWIPLTLVSLALLAALAHIVRLNRQTHTRLERLSQEHQEGLSTLEAEHGAQLDRLERERGDESRRAHLPVIRDLLPAIDALEGAIGAAEAHEELHEGLTLVERTLLGALAKHDVVVLAPEAGEAFEPQHHEAVQLVETEAVEARCVAELYRRGYRLREGQVLRPAMVAVARAPEPQGDHDETVLDLEAEEAVVDEVAVEAQSSSV